MKKIVLFLHGYGSNGNDLISLKDYILLNKETTEFISPNAPEPCEFNYFGYQWFPLKERSIKELKIGLKSAFSHLDSIIEKIILEHSVDASQISLIGFSQGSMLATYYALQKKFKFS
jgi:phospholipase/carboxylesterase